MGVILKYSHNLIKVVKEMWRFPCSILPIWTLVLGKHCSCVNFFYHETPLSSGQASVIRGYC